MDIRKAIAEQIGQLLIANIELSHQIAQMQAEIDKLRSSKDVGNVPINDENTQ